jgi:branched-subunit amino acid transport protein
MTVGTFALKSAGPLLLGDRALPLRVQQAVDLLPAALLAALTIVSTVGDGRAIAIDARLVGLVVAGLALCRRLPFVVVIVLASAATALTRLIFVVVRGDYSSRHVWSRHRSHARREDGPRVESPLVLLLEAGGRRHRPAVVAAVAVDRRHRLGRHRPSDGSRSSRSSC